MTGDILEVVSSRDKLLKQCTRSNHAPERRLAHANYKKLRNIVVNMIRGGKTEFFCV